MVGPRPPHHYLVGSALEGSPGNTRQTLAEAKARAALDGLLGPPPCMPGHRKLQRSMSAVHLPPDLELSDIVIKSGRPNEADAGSEGPLSLRLSQKPVGGAEVSSFSASVERRGSDAYSVTEEAVAVIGASAALQPAAMAAEQQQQQPLVAMPRRVLLPATGSARRPWSVEAQRGTPATPRLSRLNITSTGEQPADECSTGGSSHAPKDGLVSPGAFLEGSLSPTSERDARDLAELLQQAQQRHSKAE